MLKINLKETSGRYELQINEDIETDMTKSVVENPKYLLRKRSNLFKVSKITVARI